MRELKFRIWDGNNKKFVYPDVIELNRGLEYQQYIGLKDRDGKEIYEGDIVEQEINYPTGTIKSRGVVKFFNYMGQLGYRMQYASKYSPKLIDPNCKVIGNIYSTKQVEYTDEEIISEMVENDFVVKMPPKKAYKIHVRVKNIEKGKP